MEVNRCNEFIFIRNKRTWTYSEKMKTLIPELTFIGENKRASDQGICNILPVKDKGMKHLK